MKNNPIAALFLGLCLISALGSVWMIWSYSQSLRTLQRLEHNLFIANNAQALVQAIYNDTVEYARNSKNPTDINHVIQSLPLMHPAAAPAAAPVKR